MPALTILIPAHYDWHLIPTVKDVLAKCGDVEVIVMLDGYKLDKPLPDDKRVRVYQQDHWYGLRHTLNAGVEMASAEWVMKLDAHCIVSPGFDEVMLADKEDNWILVPSRFELDADKWQPKGWRIDSERFGCPNGMRFPALYTYPWLERGKERKEYKLDEDLCSLGSCFMFNKRHFTERIGGFSEAGYGRFIGEIHELSLKTQLGPTEGKVMRNKRAWHAHLWKVGKFKANKYLNDEERRTGNAYMFDFWYHNRWEGRVHDFEWLIDRFMPIPTWLPNWKKRKLKFSD